MSIDGELDTAIAAVEGRLRGLDSKREAAARELVELCARRERATSDNYAENGEVQADSWTR
jgi:hypothetical protein